MGVRTLVALTSVSAFLLAYRECCVCMYVHWERPADKDCHARCAGNREEATASGTTHSYIPSSDKQKKTFNYQALTSRNAGIEVRAGARQPAAVQFFCARLYCNKVCIIRYDTVPSSIPQYRFDASFAAVSRTRGLLWSRPFPF